MYRSVLDEGVSQLLAGWLAGGGGGDGGLRGGDARVGAPLIRDCRRPSPLTLQGYDSAAISFIKIVVLYLLHV